VRSIGLAVTAALAAVTPVAAQDLASLPGRVEWRDPVAPQDQTAVPWLDDHPPGTQRPSPGWASLYSLALPGAGQYVQGQKRWVAYLMAEAAGWIFWARARSRAHEYENRFRDLAWEFARDFEGPRMDGDWEYYERMLRFTRSGAYDRDPGSPGIQPEEDVNTFNGDAWRLARQIHFRGVTDPRPGDPEYRRALAFYRARAVGPEFLWDWSGRDSERTRFEMLIEESDDAFGDASLLVGAVVFNHLLSSLDGYLSGRSSRIAGSRLRFRSHLEPSRAGVSPRFSLSARLEFR